MAEIEISGYNASGGYALDPPDQPWFDRYPNPPAMGSDESRRRAAAMHALQSDPQHRHDWEMWARRYGPLKGLRVGCPERLAGRRCAYGCD